MDASFQPLNSFSITSVSLSEDHVFLLFIYAWHLTESQAQTLIISSLMS